MLKNQASLKRTNDYKKTRLVPQKGLKVKVLTKNQPIHKTDGLHIVSLGLLMFFDTDSDLDKGW